MNFGNIQTYLTELNKLNNKTNSIYSPVSVRAALQMYSIIKNTNKYKNYLNDTDYLGYLDRNNIKYINRIWLNKNHPIDIPIKILDYVYSLDMVDSEKATKEKNDFVKQQTHNFILETPSILSNDIIYDIMNIVYFKDSWSKIGGYELNPKMEFFNLDGTITHNIDNFSAYSKSVYENNTCYAISLNYTNNNRFWLVYPKKDIKKVNLNNLIWVSAVCTMNIPEFTVQAGLDIGKLFNIDKSITMSQIAKIEVNHLGTEASAVTEVVKCGAALRKDTPKRLELTFDKPFIYFIEDTTVNDFIFIGRINNM